MTAAAGTTTSSPADTERLTSPRSPSTSEGSLTCRSNTETRPPRPPRSSVWSRPLDRVDHEHLDRSLRPFELEPKLFLKRREERRLVVFGRRRRGGALAGVR